MADNTIRTDGGTERRASRGRVDRRDVLKAAGVAGVAGLSGCLSNIGGSGGGTVTYGVVSPISGSYSSLGPFQRHGAELAIQHLNESDDFGYEIEGVYGDTETGASTATQAASQLVEQDGADFVMGAISSQVGLALNSFAQENEVIYNPGAAAIPITGESCNEYVFRSETNTAQIAEGAAVWALENLGSDVWFHIADYAYGQSVLREWRSRMKSADAEFNEVGVSRAELGAQNYESYISQIQSSDADVLVVGSTGGDFVRFGNQAASAGLGDDVEIITTTASFQSLRAGLGTAGYGIYSGVRYNASLETGWNQQFVDAYTSEYPDDGAPGNFARVGYDSIRMTAMGIQEADSTDPTEVKDALAGLETNSVLGTNRYRECDQQAMNPVWVGQNVEPDSGEVADVELIEKFSGEDAIPSCESTNCSL
ncbi:ABC transporter substrate-binding protein [Halorubellus sp. PRR65]|uniref:ABC transporter substrate-binding protein n=1 Tax=Halorubellus sp. PRR65 TaxID=3098148 RepID=UPI002B25DA70|nr:ABC transporter substrate-binding protein [Halorubellus sp. PRR65]